MAGLDSIVNVQISLKTQAVAYGNFGTPMIVGPTTAFSERVRVYESYDDAVTDGISGNMLIALSDAFAQIPRPQQIKVGRRKVSVSTVHVSTVANNTAYTVTVDGVPVTYTSDSSATGAEIATGLASALNAAVSAKFTSAATGSDVTLTVVTGTPTATLGSGLTFTAYTTPDTVALDLAAINDEDDSWYGLVMVERVKQVQLDAADWAETSEKLFITASSEAGILSPSTVNDVMSLLQDQNYMRTAILYSADADTAYPDAAWASRVFTIQPGAETWALKRLGSVVASTLTATQRQTIEAKGGNYFNAYRDDVLITYPGKVVGGEWIDVIRFRDWLKDQIQVNLIMMMINRDKVPYTNGGIQLIANNVRKSLQIGQNVGGIAPDEVGSDGKTVPGFIMTVPNALDVTAAKKASRVLDLGFNARIAGAIHAVNITGSLQYEF